MTRRGRKEEGTEGSYGIYLGLEEEMDRDMLGEVPNGGEREVGRTRSLTNHGHCVK